MSYYCQNLNFYPVFFTDGLSSFSFYPLYAFAYFHVAYFQCHVPGLPTSCTTDYQCQTPWYPSSYCQSGGSCHLEPPPQCKVDSDCNPPGVVAEDIERKTMLLAWPI